MPRFCLWTALLVSVAALSAQPAEQLSYQVEWRLIDAGRTDLSWERSPSGYQGKLHVYSTGLVSRLFKVNDTYRANGSPDLCAQNYILDSEEGSRTRQTKVTWNGRKSHYLERDLKKNETVLERELEVPPCVHDVLAGLAKLRSLNSLRPGQAVTLPISDGKKFVQARIEAQDRERITTKVGSFWAIRHEAFLFNDVLFKRTARLLVWISDDSRRLPLRIQVRMRIHIGTVTFALDKVEPPVAEEKK